MSSPSSRKLLAVLLSLLASPHLQLAHAQSTEVPTSIVSAGAPASTDPPSGLASVPSCTRSCLTKATLSQPCEATDTQCLCAHAQQIHDDVLTCLAGSACSQSDITLTENYYNSLCVGLGYPLSAIGTASPTAIGTISAAPSTAATTTSSTKQSTASTTVQQSSPNSNSTTKISIIVGVAIGVGVLLIGTIIGCFWLVTRRRRREQRLNEEKQHMSPSTFPPTSHSSTTLTARPLHSSSVYSPHTTKFPSTIDLPGGRKPSILSTSTISSNPPSSPRSRHHNQQWSTFPSPQNRRKSNATAETSFTMMTSTLADPEKLPLYTSTNHHNHPPSSYHHPSSKHSHSHGPARTISLQSSASSQKLKPNPRVKEVEIRRPTAAQRVTSEAIVLDTHSHKTRDDDDACSDYTSVTEDSEDEARLRSFASARKSMRSTKSSLNGLAAKAFEGGVGSPSSSLATSRKASASNAAGVPNHNSNPNSNGSHSSKRLSIANKRGHATPQLSPGLSKFDFGLHTNPPTPGRTPGSPLSPVSSIGETTLGYPRSEYEARGHGEGEGSGDISGNGSQVWGEGVVEKSRHFV